MRRLIYLLFVLFGCSQYLSAQIDTALQLPSIEISAPRLRTHPPGERTELWDSLDLVKGLSENAAELLSRQSGVYIKSYGLGSSATSSIRGGSAGQTSVVWNGLPLQSPMLGQLDLSLLPVTFIDQMEVRYGGNGASWGSGAIGGIITLDNQARYGIGQQLDLRSSLGSFGRWDQQLKWQYGNQQWAGSTRLFYQQAKNDFPYSIRADLPEKRQSHAAVQQSGVLQEMYWKNRPNQELSLQIWAQQADRELPPLSTQTRSEAKQQDAFFRTALHWKKWGKYSILKASTGFFWEDQQYQNPLAGVANQNRYYVLTTNLDGQWQWNTHQKFQLSLNHIYTRATTEAYDGAAEQNRLSIYGAFQQKWGSLLAQVGVRQELVDGALVPIVPNLGLEFQALPWLTIKGKIARNYRLPSLNDLYWRPGGNPDLVAESGWSTELGAYAKWPMGKHQLQYSTTGFNRQINNWLMWSLQEGANYWSASNIAKVWSRGIEQRLEWQRSFVNGKIALQLGYDFILSTNEIEIQAPMIKAGEQLFYSPKHQGFGALDVYWKNWSIGYQHRYTGPVTTLGDPLDGYQVGYWHTQYEWSLKKWRIGAFVQVNNCWNEQYRVVERRPMPGRYFQIGLRLGISRPQRENIQ